MLLRSMTKHVKDQNWFAVGLDFFIVVAGILIAVQITNWNENQTARRAYQGALIKLANESNDTLEYLETTRVNINNMLADVQPAIAILKACASGADTEKAVNTGLNTIRSARSAGAGTIAIDQIINDDRYRRYQDEHEKTILRQFHDDIHGHNIVTNSVDTSVISVLSAPHPSIDFTDIVDPSETFNGVDIRRAVLGVPLDQACKDASFKGLFYNWERAHVFQLSLLNRLETTVTENARALGLSLPIRDVKNGDAK